MAKVLVLGAGFAGVNFCLEMVGTEHDVRLLDMQSFHEYTPGIIELFNDRHSEEDLRIDINQLFEDTNIEFSRERVEKIRSDSNFVETNAGSHEYEYLVVALGSEPRTYGTDISEAYTPYSIEEVKKIKDELEDAEKAVIVGSGYVGVEVAGEIRNEVDLTIIDGETRPMPRSSKKASHIALDYMNSNDISFVGGKRVKEVKENKVVTSDGSSFESDLTIWTGGIKAPQTVQDSMECGPKGVDVDSTLRSSRFPEVFVIGDCVEGSLATAHNAIKQAKIAAYNLDRKKSKMKEYHDSDYPLIVSMGKTGMMVYGRRAHSNRLLRRSKDIVFRGYKASLKARKSKSKLL